MNDRSMPCSATAALRLHEKAMDANVQELDYEDEALMKSLCGDRLAKPIQRLLVLREILSTVPDDQLRFSIKGKLDDLLAGVNEELEDQ